MLAKEIDFCFFMLSDFKIYSLACAAEIFYGVSIEVVEPLFVRDLSGILSDFINDSLRGIPGDSTSVSK